MDQVAIRLAVKVKNDRYIQMPDRRIVSVTDGKERVEWTVGSLSELFRGEQVPPPDLQQYPPEYVPCFYFIESHLLMLCDAIGDRTDQEMEEVYAALRRRPDGRSLSPIHDFMWQVSALLLGKYALSAAEFEGIMETLLSSARRWGLRPVSRFYVDYLRNELD